MSLNLPRLSRSSGVDIDKLTALTTSQQQVPQGPSSRQIAAAERLKNIKKNEDEKKLLEAVEAYKSGDNIAELARKYDVGYLKLNR